MSMKRIAMIAGCLLLFLAWGPRAGGALSPVERSQLTRIKNTINAAARYYKQDNFRECAMELRRAQKIIEKLAAHADAELLKAIEPSFRRLQRARQLVSEKGESLPAIKPLPTPAQARAAREKARAEAKAKAAARAEAAEEKSADEEASADNSEAVDADPVEKVDNEATTRGDETTDAQQQDEDASNQDASNVSFTKQVAPLLVRHCGRCHVRDSKGDFEMPTYAALMKGPENGPVIVAEQPDESSLIQLVEDGEMPPRGGPIPAKDIEILKAWVAQGAKFDGQDRTARLTTFLSAGGRPTDGGERTSRESRRPVAAE